jgi:hypothetical protein
VIPSFVNEIADVYQQYILKPLDGADSAGIKIVNHHEIEEGMLIQPLLDFQYEVSFYFIGEQFYYALYAPDSHRRWELKPYLASKEDIAFALDFIRWNTCKWGIQRVDACRTQKGELLLMELEDYNPFLSLDSVESGVKAAFLEGLIAALSSLTTRSISS